MARHAAVVSTMNLAAGQAQVRLPGPNHELPVGLIWYEWSACSSSDGITFWMISSITPLHAGP